MPHPLTEAVLSGDRAALAKAITLIESQRSDHRREAAQLVDSLLPRSGNSIRVGISGTPGVGKSTFLEALGNLLIDQGSRPAILAIDPSSEVTGGSILGDKTRMTTLAQRPEAFIRPSPTRGELGGVAARTSEAIVACEAAGFDVILVETVGVGQSETLVADITDLMVLMVAPGGGDDLQGIKRGVMEKADLLVVNKADGPRLAEAARTAADYEAGLQLVRPKWPDLATQVVTCSAHTPETIAPVWDAIKRRHDELGRSGLTARQRRDQNAKTLEREINRLVLDVILEDDRVRAEVRDLERSILGGDRSAASAAQDVADHVRSRLAEDSDQ